MSRFSEEITTTDQDTTTIQETSRVPDFAATTVRGHEEMTIITTMNMSIVLALGMHSLPIAMAREPMTSEVLVEVLVDIIRAAVIIIEGVPSGFKECVHPLK